MKAIEGEIDEVLNLRPAKYDRRNLPNILKDDLWRFYKGKGQYEYYDTARKNNHRFETYFKRYGMPERYIGKNDINNRPIFEGDFIHCWLERKAKDAPECFMLICYNTGICGYVVAQDYPREDGMYRHWAITDFVEIEVKGNIKSQKIKPELYMTEGVYKLI